MKSEMILAAVFVVALVAALIFNKRTAELGRLRSDGKQGESMKDDKTRLWLRMLAMLSFLALGAGAILPIVATFEGKRPDTMWTIALLFAGMIGIAAHRALSSLCNRISELETQGRK